MRAGLKGGPLRFSGDMARQRGRLTESSNAESLRPGGRRLGCFSNGGGGGSRTHVFLPLRRNFYMRSFIIDLDRVWG